MAPETIDLPTIRLRRPRLGDAVAILEYANDPEVARFADWPTGSTLGRLQESLLERTERWDAGEEFNWVITVPPEDNAIGGVSCRVVNHAAEVGYLLHREYWGRGFATAACRAVVEWALSVPSIWRVWATCDAENHASARVLEKAGLTREGILRRWVVRPNISSEPRDALIFSCVRDVA